MILNKYYYYVDGLTAVRICAKRKPSYATRSKRGTWVIRTATLPVGRTVTLDLLRGLHWEMPCFPEITIGTLNKIKFVNKEIAP